MHPVSKRLLVFTYHYPPSPEVGAIRWHRMGDILAARGWHVRVVAKAAEGESATGAAAHGASSKVERIGVPHRQSMPVRVAELMQSFRTALQRRPAVEVSPTAVSAPAVRPASPVAVNDAAAVNARPKTLRTLLHLAQEHRWGRDAAARGRELAADDVLVSAGPPHAVHYWISRLAKRRGLPHVIDLRDPWSLVERSVGWMDMRLYRTVARYCESRTIRDAALVVCNTEHAAAAMRTAYPAYADKVVAIMNGADPEDVPPERPWSFERFLCVHSGSIYLDRMPVALLKAARRTIDDLSLTPDDFGVAFRGVVDDELKRPLSALVASLGLTEYVQVLPRLPRTDAMRWTAEAQLCVVLPQDSRMALPSKVFELAQLPSWLLVFAPEDSATASALRGSSARLVELEDVEAATRAISDAVLQFRQHVRPRPVDETGSMRRATQVEKLDARLAPLVRG